jgi:chromosome segregation ATPase
LNETQKNLINYEHDHNKECNYCTNNPFYFKAKEAANQLGDLNGRKQILLNKQVDINNKIELLKPEYDKYVELTKEFSEIKLRKLLTEKNKLEKEMDNINRELEAIQTSRLLHKEHTENKKMNDKINKRILSLDDELKMQSESQCEEYVKMNNIFTEINNLEKEILNLDVECNNYTKKITLIQSKIDKYNEYQQKLKDDKLIEQNNSNIKKIDIELANEKKILDKLNDDKNSTSQIINLIKFIS